MKRPIVPSTATSLLRHLAVVSTVLLAACGYEQGSGRVVEEARSVAAFKHLAVSDNILAEVTLGAPSVKIKTDDNLMSLVETVIEGETLRVRLNTLAYVRASSGIRAIVVVPELLSVSASGASQVTAIASPADNWSLDASGASQITVTGVAAKTVNAKASGSSQLTISGNATELVAKASGASRVMASGLPVESVTIDGSGGSRFEVSATRSATGHLSGGSNATVTGSPTVRDISTSGGSAVTWSGQE